MRVPASRGWPVVVVACLALAACGNRLSHADAVAAAQVHGPAGATVARAPGTTTTDPLAPAPTTGTAAAPTGSGRTGTAAPAPVLTGGASATGTSAAPTRATTATAHPSAAASPTRAAAAGDATPVTICQDGTFSGIGGTVFVNAQPALATWVSWTNRNGGLAGHPVQLVSFDDTGDGNKALQFVTECVEDKHAAAIVGAMAPSTITSFQTYLEGKHVPIVGGDDDNGSWYDSPITFPEGGSPQGSADGTAVAALKAGKHALATIYCVEAPGCATLAQQVSDAAAKHGLAVKQSYQVSAANPSYTSQCQSMQSAGVDVVFPAMDGGSIQRIARDCNGIGFHPLIITGALALTDQMAGDRNLDGMIAITAQAPWVASSPAAMAVFQQQMSTYAPDAPPSEAGVKAWTSGQLLAKALSNLGAAPTKGPITPAMVLQGLATIHNEDLGGLVPGQLTFTAGKVPPDNPCWGVAILSGGRWTAPDGGTTSCG